MGQSSPYPGQNNGSNNHNNANNTKHQVLNKASTYQQFEADVAQANKM